MIISKNISKYFWRCINCCRCWHDWLYRLKHLRQSETTWGCNWSNLQKTHGPETWNSIQGSRGCLCTAWIQEMLQHLKSIVTLLTPCTVCTVQRFQQICALPINARDNNSPACLALDFHNNQPKINWAKFFSCKTRYVAENSSNFQFLVYCWKCNGKSQPEISHGRLRARRERKLGILI